LRHRLDLTVEAYVLHEEFATLFTEAARQRARNRLKSYGWQEAADTQHPSSLVGVRASK